MSMFLIPFKIQRKIEGIMRWFLWSGKAETKCLEKLDLKSVCAPLDHGGLEIKLLEIQNQSLLLKWLWKLRCLEGASLWRGIVF